MAGPSPRAPRARSRSIPKWSRRTWGLSVTDTLLEVNNIETFYGPIMAIRGEPAVPRGAIVTILGANGAGKTTILKTVSGVMDAQKAR